MQELTTIIMKIGSGDYFHVYSLHFSFYVFTCPLLEFHILNSFFIENFFFFYSCYDFVFAFFVDMFRKLYVETVEALKTSNKSNKSIVIDYLLLWNNL